MTLARLCSWANRYFIFNERLASINKDSRLPPKWKGHSWEYQSTEQRSILQLIDLLSARVLGRLDPLLWSWNVQFGSARWAAGSLYGSRRCHGYTNVHGRPLCTFALGISRKLSKNSWQSCSRCWSAYFLFADLCQVSYSIPAVSDNRPAMFFVMLS